MEEDGYEGSEGGEERHNEEEGNRNEGRLKGIPGWRKVDDEGRDREGEKKSDEVWDGVWPCEEDASVELNCGQEESVGEKGPGGSGIGRENADREKEDGTGIGVDALLDG